MWRILLPVWGMVTFEQEHQGYAAFIPPPLIHDFRLYLVARWCIDLFCAVLPACVPVGMILRFSTNFPFWDEWDPDISGTFVKARQHQLTFASLDGELSVK